MGSPPTSSRNFCSSAARAFAVRAARLVVLAQENVGADLSGRRLGRIRGVHGSEPRDVRSASPVVGRVASCVRPGDPRSSGYFVTVRPRAVEGNCAIAQRLTRDSFNPSSVRSDRLAHLMKGWEQSVEADSDGVAFAARSRERVAALCAPALHECRVFVPTCAIRAGKGVQTNGRDQSTVSACGAC